MGARPASCTSLQFLKRGVGDASVSAPAFTDTSAEADEVSLEVAEGCCEGAVSLGVAEGDSAGDSEGDSDGAATGELALGAGAEGDSEGTLLGFSEGDGVSEGVSFGTDESDGAAELSTTVTVAATPPRCRSFLFNEPVSTLISTLSPALRFSCQGIEPEILPSASALTSR